MALTLNLPIVPYVEVHWSNGSTTLEPAYYPDETDPFDIPREKDPRLKSEPLTPKERFGIQFWRDASGNWHGERT